MQNQYARLAAASDNLEAAYLHQAQKLGPDARHGWAACFQMIVAGFDVLAAADTDADTIRGEVATAGAEAAVRAYAEWVA